MDFRVIQEIHTMIDRYTDNPELNNLLKTFVEAKRQEGSKWSDITLQTHYMMGGDSPAVYRNAALAELVILAFDMADDLQDQDNPQVSWMKTPSELTLNSILSLLVTCMGECPSGASADMARLLSLSINGQHTDLTNTAENEEEYIRMVYLKSGSLLRFACYMGYTLLPLLEPEKGQILDELAGMIGVIAQLGNDLQDVVRLDEKNDLLLRKRTLPVLYLLKDSAEEFPVLDQYYSGRLTAQEFLSHKKECLNYIHSSGCLEYTRIIQALYIDKAEELFTQLNALSPWKEQFRAITFAPREQEEPAEAHLPT